MIVSWEMSPYHLVQFAALPQTIEMDVKATMEVLSVGGEGEGV
jgi:hypothetical protein